MATDTCTDEVKSKPTWQVRRRNKAAMPRPKSMGYLKDFNILAAQDDVEDTTDRAYDDFVYSKHFHAKDDNLSSNFSPENNLTTDLRKKNGCVFYNDFNRNEKKGKYVMSNNDLKGNAHLNSLSNSDSSQYREVTHNATEDVAIKRNRGRDDFVLTRDVSGRAAYWQKREDDSHQPTVCTSSSILKDWKTPGQIRQLKDQVDPKEMTQYIYDKGVANRAAMWQKLEDDHFEKMMINPDKEWKGPAIRLVLDRNHPEYGRPPKGSKTEKRGIKAYKHVVKEIGELCKIIADNGEKQADGTVTITFRKLFHTYVSISNKVVGILIRARKRGLLHFNGEMLYQRQDEDEIIRLFSVPDEVE